MIIGERLFCLKTGLIVAGAAVFAGCGGPAKIIDPPPTQSVQHYFAGTDETAALHLHVDWTQTGRTIVLRNPCVPQDNCRIYPWTEPGNPQLDSSFPVNLASGSGTFSDPGITFTVTTVNGKTFTFTGAVATSGDQVQMTGTLSGPTHPASRLVLDKQAP